jgi:hypothetical protein
LNKLILINVFRAISIPGAPLPKAMMVTPAIFCESLGNTGIRKLKETTPFIVVGNGSTPFIAYTQRKGNYLPQREKKIPRER